VGEHPEATASEARFSPTCLRGHRQRLRDRFSDASAQPLTDRELLELILSRAISRRREVRQLADALLSRFGTFADVVAAPRVRLGKVEGLREEAIWELKLMEAAARRFARAPLEKRPVVGSSVKVVDYCRTLMAYAEREEFRVLFLDKRHRLIADELHSVGTVDCVYVYPREVVRRALELAASGLVLAHCHPSGDPTPSSLDVDTTHQIVALAQSFGIQVRDHVIIGREGHASLKALGLI